MAGRNWLYSVCDKATAINCLDFQSITAMQLNKFSA